MKNQKDTGTGKIEQVFGFVIWLLPHVRKAIEMIKEILKGGISVVRKPK